MKTMFRIMAMLLAFVMLFAFAGCGATTGNPAATTPQGTNPAQDGKDYSNIAGEYLLDASNLGMPMKWYIKVTADGKFVISTARDYATVKGEGTIGSKDGTYMFMYSDSTTESPKTATFTMQDKNMVFSTSIPIGAASVSPNLEENDYPVAKIIAYEDLQGSYLGEFEKAAMGSSVVYNYELTLGNGMEYTFTSSFNMMGETSTRTENGTFAVDGTKITFTAKTVDGEAVSGTAVDGTVVDQTIQAAFKLSTMAAEAQEIEARLGVYAEQAGVYTAIYEGALGDLNLSQEVKLKLDAFGGYQLAAYTAGVSSIIDYTEEGTYTLSGDKFTFTSTGGATTEGTLKNYVMSAKFAITQTVPTAVDLSFYAQEVSGTFTSVITSDDNGKTYAATLELRGDSFTLTVTEQDAINPAYIAKGTFVIEKAMLCSVVLTTTEVIAQGVTVGEIPAELATVNAPVAESGINAELLFDLDDSAVLGFQFIKG